MLNKINALLNKSYLPVILKILSMIFYVMFIIIGLNAYSEDPIFLKQLRNTNLANLIVWSVWWPAIIILSVLFGRIWCMVCPIELITSFFAKIGLKYKRPDWVLSGWAVTIFYIIILFVGIQLFSIHRNPFYMAFYLLIILVTSIIVGLIYEKNTFCRYFCPVGYLLGLYSRLSFLGWRVKSKNVCSDCKDKSCVHKSYRYNLNKKSCGVDLYPIEIDDNTDCIMCAGCLKTCSEYQSVKNINRPNVGLKFIGFCNSLLKIKTLKVSEMVFVFVVSGFVISEIWSEWKITDGYLGYIPNIITDFLGIENKSAATLVKSIVLFVGFPAVIWSIPFIFFKLIGYTISLKDYMVQYGIAFIPIIATAHINKTILKFTSRIPYFEHVCSDVYGIETAGKIIDKSIILTENPSWLISSVSVLLTLMIILGIFLSFKVIINIKINSTSARIDRIAGFSIPVFYGGIFFVMIIFWRWLI